jgi:hypothetical protein
MSLSEADGTLFDDEEMQKLYDDYTSKVKSAYGKGIDDGLDSLEEALTDGEVMSLETFTVLVTESIESGMEDTTKPLSRAYAKKYINRGYKKFRKDASVLNGGSTVKAVLDLPDYRALVYFKTSDELYLGKFITDADTRQRLTAFIKDTYLRYGEAITNNPQAIARFRASLKTALMAEDWKINRVIATTVNKMRNYAAVNYMAQAEIKEFEIRGVNDRKQCDYCKNMQGRRFSVVDVAAKVDDIVSSDPEFVADDSPFLTSVFKKASDMKGLTDVEIYGKGISLPPFHCHCRDIVIAVI